MHLIRRHLNKHFRRRILPNTERLQIIRSLCFARRILCFRNLIVDLKLNKLPSIYDVYNVSDEFNFSNEFKARFKRRSSHAPNRM